MEKKKCSCGCKDKCTCGPKCECKKPKKTSKRTIKGNSSW